MKIRILCIDDEPGILEMLSMVFASEPDFEACTLSDVREWRAVVERFRPDVILVDYRMPAMSGERFLAELQASGLRSRVCGVALFSGCHLTEHDARAMGADAFFEKPFDLDSLIAGIRRLALSKDLPCAS